jgi:hypothetical protein
MLLILHPPARGLGGTSSSMRRGGASKLEI